MPSLVALTPSGGKPPSQFPRIHGAAAQRAVAAALILAP